MRHRNYGRKLSRNSEHRRALLRNLVTSLIVDERIETTVAKAKAARSVAERLITLGKRGDPHARRLAERTCMTSPAVNKLFDELAKRFAARTGGYTRIVHTGWRRGDGADLALLELVDTQVMQRLEEKRAKRSETRRKKEEEQAAAEKAQAAAETPEKEEK